MQEGARRPATQAANQGVPLPPLGDHRAFGHHIDLVPSELPWAVPAGRKSRGSRPSDLHFDGVVGVRWRYRR
jgi:hypothetical protein